MPARKPVKTRAPKLRIVAVIADGGDLQLAGRMDPSPDLFELRLDCVAGENGLERKIRRLAAPLIITARHPAEGGRHNLSTAARRELLLRFLPMAKYVDVELRSARFCGAVFHRARRIGVSTIISFHDLNSTPSLTSLRAKARQAAGFGPAVFKVATRTDTPEQLGRLMQFASEHRGRIPLAAMGIGRLGSVSRLLLVQYGSILAYTSVGKPHVEGQLSMKGFTKALRQIGFADSTVRLRQRRDT